MKFMLFLRYLLVLLCVAEVTGFGVGSSVARAEGCLEEQLKKLVGIATQLQTRKDELNQTALSRSGELRKKFIEFVRARQILAKTYYATLYAEPSAWDPAGTESMPQVYSNIYDYIVPGSEAKLFDHVHALLRTAGLPEVRPEDVSAIANLFRTEHVADLQKGAHDGLFRELNSYWVRRLSPNRGNDPGTQEGIRREAREAAFLIIDRMREQPRLLANLKELLSKRALEQESRALVEKWVEEYEQHPKRVSATLLEGVAALYNQKLFETFGKEIAQGTSVPERSTVKRAEVKDGQIQFVEYPFISANWPAKVKEWREISEKKMGFGLVFSEADGLQRQRGWPLRYVLAPKKANTEKWSPPETAELMDLDLKHAFDQQRLELLRQRLELMKDRLKSGQELPAEYKKLIERMQKALADSSLRPSPWAAFRNLEREVMTHKEGMRAYLEPEKVKGKVEETIQKSHLLSFIMNIYKVRGYLLPFAGLAGGIGGTVWSWVESSYDYVALTDEEKCAALMTDEDFIRCVEQKMEELFKKEFKLTLKDDSHAPFLEADGNLAASYQEKLQSFMKERQKALELRKKRKRFNAPTRQALLEQIKQFDRPTVEELRKQLLKFAAENTDEEEYFKKSLSYLAEIHENAYESLVTLQFRAFDKKATPEEREKAAVALQEAYDQFRPILEEIVKEHRKYMERAGKKLLQQKSAQENVDKKLKELLALMEAQKEAQAAPPVAPPIPPAPEPVK